MGKSSVKNLFSNQIIADYLKGIIVALFISLALIVFFAFSLGWFDISDNFIPAITLAVKGVSVFVGSILAVKGDSKGLLKGSLFGLIYIVLAFLIFSLLSGVFSITLNFVIDVIFASLLGGIVGIVKVNKNSKF